MYTRTDFAQISKESSNCFKACSNLCTSFSVVPEGLSDIRWHENGTNHKSVASKQQNTLNFFASMKYKTLHTSKTPRQLFYDQQKNVTLLVTVIPIAHSDSK